MKKLNLFICGLVLIIFPLISFSSSSPVLLKPGYPQQYVVKPGDTLWSIANKYLQHPWQWKKLWHANPQIANPDEILPGAVLEMRTYKGQPSLVMVHNGMVAIAPQLHRRHHVAGAIPTIPLHLIKPFLDASQVFDTDILAGAPYVVAFQGEHIVAGAGNALYVKGLYGAPTDHYSIYRPEGYFRQPAEGRILGFQAKHLGDGRLVRPGNPATLVVINSVKDIRVGDRVIITPPQAFNSNFVLQEPANPIYGQVIAFINALDQVARYQIVVVNLGIMNGLVPGDMLGIYKRGDIIQDPLNSGLAVHLPAERIADIMIFRSFRFVSYGLVMHSLAPISMFDLAQNP